MHEPAVSTRQPALSARFLTAALLLPVFAGALLLLPNAYWRLLLVPGLWIASLEWGGLAGYGRRGRIAFATVMLAAALALMSFPNLVATVSFAQVLIVSCAIATVFWVVVAPLWLVWKWHSKNAWLSGMVGGLVLLPAWLALAGLQTHPALLLILLGVVWVADSAAYLVGRRFGRHRLAPAVSPGKTWEGVLGAAAAVALYYGVVWSVAPQQAVIPGLQGILLFAVVTILSIEGDLFESLMKRQAGVKDSGSLLPGHGGLLDRIDGLTASLPLAAVWLYGSGRLPLS